MDENLKNEICSMRVEDLLLQVMHDTRAPINACLGVLILFQEVEITEELNEGSKNLLANLAKHLEKIKQSHDMMSEWLKNQSNKNDL